MWNRALFVVGPLTCFDTWILFSWKCEFECFLWIVFKRLTISMKGQRHWRRSTATLQLWFSCVMNSIIPSDCRCTWKSLKNRSVNIFSCNVQSCLFFLASAFPSFIHSGYLYSAATSSSPLLLRGAPDTERILCLSFTRSATGNCEWRTCPRPFGRKASNLPMSNQAPHLAGFH